MLNERVSFGCSARQRKLAGCFFVRWHKPLGRPLVRGEWGHDLIDEVQPLAEKW